MSDRLPRIDCCLSQDGIGTVRILSFCRNIDDGPPAFALWMCENVNCGFGRLSPHQLTRPEARPRTLWGFNIRSVNPNLGLFAGQPFTGATPRTGINLTARMPLEFLIRLNYIFCFRASFLMAESFWLILAWWLAASRALSRNDWINAY